MTLFLSAVITVLAAQTALAERVNKPFNTVNGRSSAAGASRADKPSAPVAGAAPAVTNEMIAGAPSGGGRAFMGRGSQVPRGMTGRNGGGKTFWAGKSRRVDADEGTPEEAPPNFNKPGALIRTTGQMPKYEKAEDPKTHTVNAGEIVFNDRKAIHVGRGPGIQQGAKDTPPPPNPGDYGRGYGTGISANSPAPSSGSGGNNNGSGNNGKDKPGDDDDQHGGDKRMQTAFYDAF